MKTLTEAIEEIEKLGEWLGDEEASPTPLEEEEDS